MPYLPDPQSSWTPFRQAEKHFKARHIPQTTPPLPFGILDLSRPECEEDDEVWKSGWWGPEEDEGMVKYRRRKGKERARGGRGDSGLEGIEALKMGDGRIGYVVAEGEQLLSRLKKGGSCVMVGLVWNSTEIVCRLYIDTPILESRGPTITVNLSIERIHTSSKPSLTLDTLPNPTGLV